MRAEGILGEAPREPPSSPAARRWLSGLVGRVVFRLPGHAARKLAGFARAEQASCLDLRLAAAQTSSIERRALYLRHALDEARHAQIFARAVAELRTPGRPAPLGPEHADADDLFERLGEVRFVAFVHRGERRGRAQFEAYRAVFAARGDARMTSLFDAIAADELRHETYTGALLRRLAGSEAMALRALRSVALWEAWRAFRRVGRSIAGAVYVAAMVVLYFVVAPLALFVRLVRPARVGFRLEERR